MLTRSDPNGRHPSRHGTVDMARPNIVVLRQLQQSLPAAQKLFAMLAEQDELGEWVTVDELIDNLELGRRNAVDLLREFAEAGVGDFRVGRKGHPSRLVWSTDPRQLVDRVLGRKLDDAELESVGPERKDDDAAVADESESDHDEPPTPGNGRSHDFHAPAPAQAPARSQAVEHVFVLRPELRVALALPVDLSPREAAALAEWVRNLSFDR